MEQIRGSQHSAVNAAVLLVVGRDHVQHIRRQEPALPGREHIGTAACLKLNVPLQHINQLQFLMPVPWDTAIRVQIQIIQIYFHWKSRRAMTGDFLQVSVYLQIV